MQQVAKKNKVKKMQNNKIKVKNLFKFLAKSKHKAGEGLEYGQYPFYTSSATVNKYFDEYDFESNKLIFATGGSASVHYAKSKFAVSTDNFVLEPFENVNAKYVYYYLKSNIQILQDGFHGAGLQHLSKDYLSEIGIPMLNSTEQQKIVSILDKADEIRTKKKQANEKLDEFLKSTFISMFGDPKINPNNYEFVTINDLTTEISDIGSNGSNAVVASNLVMNDTEDYAYMIRTLNFNDINIMNNMKYVSKKVYDFFKKSQIFGNEIIMCKIGSAGKFWIMPKLDKPVSLGLNQFFMRFNDRVLREFVYYFLCTGFGQNEINNRISGAVTKSITKGAIRTIPIYLPSIDEQNKFAKIVEKVETQKQKNEQVIEQMDNLFNSLSQRAFKGKLTKPNVVDLLTRQVALHSKIIDKCNSHQTFGAVKLEKIFNLCDMIQELNLVPGGYYRKAAGPYVPEIRHTVEQELLQNNWVKITNQGNGKKVEYKKDSNFTAYKAIYNQIFDDKNQEIENIINYFYDKDTNYCEAFSTLYMCWNDLILERENPTKTEIIDEFKNHWAPEKQRFERIYLLEILSDMSNQGFEPQGHGVHTIESNYNHNKDQLSLQLK